MLRNGLSLFGLLCLLFLGACKSGENTAMPVAITDTIDIKVDVSTFNIPIRYSLESLEKFLNGKFQGNFLETIVTPTKNEKDRVKVSLKKLRDIELSSNGKELFINFPLQVSADILQSRINFITKKMNPVVAELVVRFATPVDLDPDWHLKTDFKLKDLKWEKPVVVKLAGIKIDLTKKVEAAVEKKKPEIEALLNLEVNKAVSLEKPVGKIWDDLQKPMVINKKAPVAYLKFIPLSISGNLDLAKKEVTCFTSMQVIVAMVTESNIRARHVALPAYKRHSRRPGKSDVKVYAFAELKHLNEDLAGMVDGKQISAGDYDIFIRRPKIFTSDSGLTISLDTEGSFDTKVYATIRPYFDSAQQTIKTSDFQFFLSTEDVLLSTANTLLNNRIRDTLRQALSFGVDTLIEKIPNLINNAINRGNVGKTIDLDLQDFVIRSCDIKWDAKRVHFLVHTTFEADMQLKALRSGKKVKIKGKPKPK
jgi:hypothetical protein